ncbi:hypothetical protein [Novosphingobium sp.]|uniref:hypothetical protein n=1 Tax=Novosphingobium sp. TaxID=1874826 RepID=UPI0028B16B6A|nr:hypothetical protein [Novosphingobium sp.]
MLWLSREGERAAIRADRFVRDDVPAVTEISCRAGALTCYLLQHATDPCRRRSCIASVHDGDTVRLCDGERLQLINIDAPEVAGSPRCSAQSRARLAASPNPPWCDDEAGAASRDQLRALLSSGTPAIQRNAVVAGTPEAKQADVIAMVLFKFAAMNKSRSMSQAASPKRSSSKYFVRDRLNRQTLWA